MRRFAAIIIWLAAAGMFFAGRGCGRDCGGRQFETTTRTDTVVVRDTLRDTVLVPVERFAVRVDTVWMQAAGDTVRIEVEAPVERRVYATDDYRAVVEGFRPALVEMELYLKTARITSVATRTSPPDRWGIGIQAGWGLGPKGAVPYVGIGVQYNVLAW